MIEDKVKDRNSTNNELLGWNERHEEMLNFQARYRPYIFERALRRAGLSKQRAKDLKNIYKSGVYYLVQLELQYAELETERDKINQERDDLGLK